MRKDKPVIIGLGNPLFQDEGLGIHVIYQLMQEKIADQAELIDGGTDALALLGIVEATEYLLIIDAVSGDGPAGSIQRVNGQEIPLFLAVKVSPHQIGMQEVLALASLRGRLPDHMALIGIQPQSMDWGTELTTTVADMVPQLIKLVYEQVDAWREY